MNTVNTEVKTVVNTVVKTVVNTEVESPSYTKFLAFGKEFQFVRFESPDNIIAIRDIVKVGEHNEYRGIIKAERMDIETLKSLKIWEQLDKEVQERMIKGENEPPENLQKAWQAKKENGPKYPNIPHEVTCCECGKVQKMSPGQIVKYSTKWATRNAFIPDVEKWLKQWKCQECHPSKGRKANPNLPPKVILSCKCGAKVIYPSSVALKFATKKGLTLEKYIENFVCQKCCSSKGRKANSNLPPKVELKCKCGVVVTYPASIALKNAIKKGLTVEKYIKSFRCQSCKNTKGRRKK